MSVRLSTILDAFADLAPLEMAEPWDNVGLLAGDRAQSVSRAMLTIDYTPDVAAEAKAAACELMIAYHPPLFTPLTRITADRPTDLIHDAIRRGVAIYSPHTALDVAIGGTNDVLADALAMVDRAPLKIRDPSATYTKLVVFVPNEAADRVRDAVFDAGGGEMGKYSRCSFVSPGQGTFMGGEGSDPQYGSAGNFETVDERRVEILVPLDRVPSVIEALRRAHPYEEPAFEFQALVPRLLDIGIGRRGRLPSSITLEMVANLLRRALGVERLLIAGERDRMISRVAVCAGAGGELMDAAITYGADLYVTGELRHHDALKAQRAGMSVICTLHSNSERVALTSLAARLRERVAGVDFTLSQTDRDPFVID